MLNSNRLMFNKVSVIPRQSRISITNLPLDILHEVAKNFTLEDMMAFFTAFNIDYMLKKDDTKQLRNSSDKELTPTQLIQILKIIKKQIDKHKQQPNMEQLELQLKTQKTSDIINHVLLGMIDSGQQIHLNLCYIILSYNPEWLERITNIYITDKYSDMIMDNSRVMHKLFSIMINITTISCINVDVKYLFALPDQIQIHDNKFINSLQQLKELNLTDCYLNDIRYNEFRLPFSSLTKFSCITKNIKMTIFIGKVFDTNQDLESVTIYNNSFTTDDVVNKISTLIKLKELILKLNLYFDLLLPNILSKCELLTNLTILDQNASSIIQFIHKSAITSLKQINLIYEQKLNKDQYEYMGNITINILYEVIEKNTYLTDIYIKCYSIEGVTIKDIETTFKPVQTKMTLSGNNDPQYISDTHDTTMPPKIPNVYKKLLSLFVSNPMNMVIIDDRPVPDAVANLKETEQMVVDEMVRAERATTSTHVEVPKAIDLSTIHTRPYILILPDFLERLSNMNIIIYFNNARKIIPKLLTLYNRSVVLEKYQVELKDRIGFGIIGPHKTRRNKMEERKMQRRKGGPRRGTRRETRRETRRGGPRTRRGGPRTRRGPRRGTRRGTRKGGPRRKYDQ